MKKIFFLRIQDAQNKSNKCNYFATRSMIFCSASHLYSALDGAERVMMIDLYVPGDCKIRRKRKFKHDFELTNIKFFILPLKSTKRTRSSRSALS